MAMMVLAYVGLGSNVGDLEANLVEAIKQLSDHRRVSVVEVSSFIVTKAVSQDPQPDYLNGVVSLKTDLTVNAFFELLVQIEKRMGRVGKGTGLPRVIDLDLLLFGDVVVDEEALTVPHPLMKERQFVLEPLNEIAPEVVHSVLKMPYSQWVSRKIIL